MKRAGPPPLYPSETEIAELVLGPGHHEEWRGLATVWERHGLPPMDEATGRRFWPAVELWFRARHGLGSVSPGQLATAPDGGETCPQPRPKSRRGSSSEHVATVHRLITGKPDKTS